MATSTLCGVIRFLSQAKTRSLLPYSSPNRWQSSRINHLCLAASSLIRRAGTAVQLTVLAVELPPDLPCGSGVLEDARIEVGQVVVPGRRHCIKFSPPSVRYCSNSFCKGRRFGWRNSIAGPQKPRSEILCGSCNCLGHVLSCSSVFDSAHVSETRKLLRAITTASFPRVSLLPHLTITRDFRGD